MEDAAYSGPLKLLILNFGGPEGSISSSGCSFCAVIYTVWPLDLGESSICDGSMCNTSGPGPGPHPRYNGSAKSS